MNDHSHHHQSDLPQDLAEIARLLDGLAMHERTAAGPLFEQRIADAVPILPHLHEVDTLALAERDAAPDTLEDRIFVATRALLRPAAAVPSEAEAAPAAPLRVEFRRYRWATRVAAVLALGGAVAAIYISRPIPTPVGPTPGPAPLADASSLDRALEDDFARFARIMSVTMTENENETASSTDSDDSVLPRLDLLTIDMEGSL